MSKNHFNWIWVTDACMVTLVTEFLQIIVRLTPKTRMIVVYYGINASNASTIINNLMTLCASF